MTIDDKNKHTITITDFGVGEKYDYNEQPDIRRELKNRLRPGACALFAGLQDKA